jgi:hypothetical protein
VSRKIKIYTIEPGAHYQIHEVVNGRQEGGADVHGSARDAAKRARALADGTPIKWVKSGSPKPNRGTAGVTRTRRSASKPRGARLPSGAPNNAYHRVRRVGETKFELDGRVYDISKKDALYALRDKVGVNRASDLRDDLMAR